MAKYVVTQGKVTFNGTDVSAVVARAELALNAAEVDTTDFASGGFTEVVGGLKSGSVSLDFHHDYGAGAISTLMSTAVGSLATVVVIPNGTAASASSPAWTATVLVNSFTPVSGAVGDLATFSVSFPTSGTVSFATA